MIRRLSRDLVVALVALALGLAGAVLVLGRDAADDPAGADGPDLSSSQEATPVTATPAGPVPAGRPAADPASAVDAFLDAEAEGDYESSFLLLAAPDRSAAKSPARWRAAHDDMPRVAGHELGDVAEEGDRATVLADMRYEPVLDPFVGLVPARARATWTVVREGDGWAVDHRRTAVTPQLPPDDGAVDAAESWVERRRACDDAGELEYAGGLLTGEVAAGDLCDAATAAVGPVAPLDGGASAAPFLSEFGDEVLDWARTVDLRGPSPMRIVLAPLGERWLVIGVLPTPR